MSFLIEFSRKIVCIKIRIKYRDPALELYTLGCSSIHTLQIIQRTVLGLAPPKAGHGCQRYFGKFIKQTM
jgi:hypothetical protein